MKRLLIALGCLTVPVSLFPFPGLSAQKRAITVDDYLALKSVGNPQLSPDGKWVAYTVTEQSLKDNRGITRIWLADVASGSARQLTAGPGSDRQPRWSPDGRTLAFVSTRENGAQLWVLPIAGGEARRLTSLADGVFDPVWLPDGTGLVVTSDIKWPAHQEIDRRNGDFPTDARLWTGFLWRHWDDVRPRRRSPAGKCAASLPMEGAVFEADRQRLMLTGRSDGGTDGPSVEATRGWTLSVGSYVWCPDSKCLYAVVEERGRDNVYRIDLPSFRRSVAVGGGGGNGGGVNTEVQVMPDGRGLLYLHQSNTQPNGIWLSGRQFTHHTDAALETLDLRPLDQFGFVGALGDSVFGWLLKPPGFDAARRYPLIYLIHGGPQGAWTDYWGARWNYAMFASRGYVVAAVHFHGSTGYGQKVTDAISQYWGDYPYQDLMKGLDGVARLPYVGSTRMGAAGASYGGYMIYWMAGHTSRFKTLVAHDGLFNPVNMAGTTEELWFVDWEFGGTPYANRALYEKWSPLNFVQNWKTPILIVHSQLDYRVDLSEGYQAFTAAKLQGVPAKCLYFPDEGHWVLRPRNRRLWWETVLDWIDQYLKPPPTGAR